MFRTRIMTTTLLLLCGICALGSTAPQVIRYQGRLTDGSGQAVTAPTEVTFSFYSEETGGTPLAGFSDTDTVTPNTDGIYTTLVGDVSPGVEIPTEILANSTVYLNVRVGGEDLSPRMLVTPSAYALDAQTLSGYDISQVQLGVQSFTAAEDIQAGNLVGLNPQGQVQKLAYPQSGPVVYFGQALDHLAGVQVDANRFLIAYMDVWNGYYGKANLVTIDDVTPSYSDQFIFDATSSASLISACLIGPDKVLLVYNGNGVSAVVGEISGDTVNFGLPVQVDPTGGYSLRAVAVDTDTALIVYDRYDGVGGQAVVATVSGTVPSFSLPVTYEPPYTMVFSLTKLDETRVFVVYANTSEGGLRGRVATISAGEVTFGDVTWLDGGYNSGAATTLLAPNKVFMAWNWSAANASGVVITIAGDTATVGTPAELFHNNYVWPLTVTRLSDERALVVFGDPSACSTTGVVALVNGTQTVCEQPFTFPVGCFYQGVPFGLGVDRTLVTEYDGGAVYSVVMSNLLAGLNRYVGVAEQTVSSGTTCRVTVSGGVTQQFSGLFPGRNYYATYDGLSTVPDPSLNAPAGRALSATRFLVQD